MRINMGYGEKKIALNIPDSCVVDIIKANPLEISASEEDLILNALFSPISSPRLAEIVCPKEKTCIVVGDVTRKWVKHDRFLPYILRELNSGGINDKDIFILSGTGDHRKQSSMEHRSIVGEEVFARIPIYDHSSCNYDELVNLGETSFGTPVIINRRAVEADRVIITGGIVYHFLAGWGGGKKAIVPGIADRKTIMNNHSLAFLPGKQGLNPEVCAGQMKGNPCSEDMLEGAAFVKPDFLLNTAIDEESGRIAGVFAGHYIMAHEKGCNFIDKHFRINTGKKAELVIVSCGGYPKDINFYQTYKAIYNANFALKQGGTLFLLSDCCEGVGNEQFFKLFTDYSSNFEREAVLRHDYSIGRHMAYHTALIAEENDIIVLSSLPDDTVKAMGMVPVKSLEEGIDWIRLKYGGMPECLVMPHGSSTLPHCHD